MFGSMPDNPLTPQTPAAIAAAAMVAFAEMAPSTVPSPAVCAVCGEPPRLVPSTWSELFVAGCGVSSIGLAVGAAETVDCCPVRDADDAGWICTFRCCSFGLCCGENCIRPIASSWSEDLTFSCASL